MPGRYIREGILTSERVDELSCGGEIFFRRLMSVADDYGRYDRNLSLLRAHLFPLKIDSVTAAEIQTWLEECEAAHLIESFTDASGKAAVEILHFEQRKRAPSKYPRDNDARQASDIERTDDGQMHSSTRPRPSTRPNARTSTENGEDEADADNPIIAGVSLRDAVESRIQTNRSGEFVFDRSDLIGSVKSFVDTGEWQRNAGMWRKRAKFDKAALANALEDFAARTPDERSKIKDRARWLTHRFGQCKKELP
ncbi:MAG: hypothetical protein H0W34_00300 [Pyrinomonadaceae bacterium]|nr:hypothetical protein [Chthoniobacterales bacterium]MBA3570429.1 hypothetical protein [Pyrinomonadaceae bacterium]